MNDSFVVYTIISNINKGIFPHETNAIYSFIFRGDVEFTLNDGSKWLQNWCGYHSSFVLSNGQIIKYLVVGDTNFASASDAYLCEELNSINSPNKNGGADAIVNIYAHEMVEIITNWDYAWYLDSEGAYSGEIGDLCLFNFGVDTSTTNWNIEVGAKKFLVQTIWRPGYGCVYSCC